MGRFKNIQGGTFRLHSWAVLILLKNGKDKAVQGRLEKWNSKRLIEELGSRERHEREVLGGKMYGVSTGRDAGEWSEEEKKKGQWKILKKQKENKCNCALMDFKFFKGLTLNRREHRG